MKFRYNIGDRTVECIYWSDPLTLAEFESDLQSVDEIQVRYPKSIDDSIYTKYGDALQYIELAGNWGGKSASKWIWLSESKEKIYQGFSKNARYEIRRAQDRDNLKTIFYIGDSLTDEKLNEYCAFYNRFAAEKSLSTQNQLQVKTLAKNGIYLLSVVTDVHGNWLTVHGIILDQKMGIAALHSSSSLFREDKVHAQLISRANRYLHFSEMCWAKENGYLIYDVGGYYVKDDICPNENIDNKEHITVSNFKDTLGGEVVFFKTGYIFSNDIYNIITSNLIKHIGLLNSRKIIIYGYGHWGKFIEKYLKTTLGLDVYLRIDNGLYDLEKGIYNHQALGNLRGNKYIIILTLDRGNCYDVLNDYLFQSSDSLKTVICARLRGNNN